MWNPQSPSPAERRDRGLGRLRAFTTASVVLAGTLVAVFAGLAARDFPGHDSGAPANASAAPQPEDSQQPAAADDNGGTLQAPPGGFFGSGGGGRGRATSGGS